jgi:hypothetical protein
MRTIYIDSDFKCYTSSADGLTAVETSFFDGKCDTYIEGYRFVPSGEEWTRSDGNVFRGEMVAPWKDYRELDAAQKQYERMMLEAETAYREGVNSVD